ncbi:MAG: PH domain-containing protein [Geodermatophilaceae bacterium]
MTLPTPAQTPPPTPTSTLSWAPRPGETALAAAGGAAMAAIGFTVDPTGRWLVWAAAALLFGIAAVDLVVRPKLRADPYGVTVRALSGATSAPWSEVQVSLRQHQRFGRSVATVELELEEKLIILGRRELGADPEQVAARLAQLRSSS